MLLSAYLSSTVIEGVNGHQQPGEAVAYFYFDFRDGAKQSLAQAIRSLLVQFCAKSTEAFRILEDIYKNHNQGQQTPHCREIVKALSRVVDTFSRAYIILDALDECPERYDLLNFLEDKPKWKPEQLKVLVTSRPLSDIKEALDNVGAQRVALESNLVDNDIKTHVHFRILREKALNKWPSSVREDIEKCLTEGAAGM
jgi:hypothetical protein